jgi:hypothetical protein
MLRGRTGACFETREFRTSVGAEWPFLSNPGRKVQKDLDIEEYTDPHHDPMIPHTGCRRSALWQITGCVPQQGRGPRASRAR